MLYIHSPTQTRALSYVTKSLLKFSRRLLPNQPPFTALASASHGAPSVRPNSASSRRESTRWTASSSAPRWPRTSSPRKRWPTCRLRSPSACRRATGAWLGSILYCYDVLLLPTKYTLPVSPAPAQMLQIHPTANFRCLLLSSISHSPSWFTPQPPPPPPGSAPSCRRRSTPRR